MQGLAGVFGRRAEPKRIVEGVSCSASAEKDEDSHCEQVLTDNRDETWHAGGKAPAHIDIDLGAEYKVSHLRLLPYQVPTSGHAVHKLYVGSDADHLEPAGELNCETRHHQWLDNVPLAVPKDKAVRFVRVETVESPAWVAWSGIQVFGNKA